MKYYYRQEVQYQDVDPDRRLRLYTLEEYLLGVAGKVADDLGFGIKYLYPQCLTWVLTHMSVLMSRLPGPTEILTIETWIESNAHMLSTRDYRLYVGEGDGKELIGCAKSVWAVLTLDTREIVNVFDQKVFQDGVDGEVLEMERAPQLRPIERLKSTLPNATFGSVDHKVHYSDCDYNRHCHSCNYLRIMMDAELPSFLDGGIRLDINYNKELHMGESMTTLYASIPDYVQYQQVDQDGRTSCTARITALKD